MFAQVHTTVVDPLNRYLNLYDLGQNKEQQNGILMKIINYKLYFVSHGLLCKALMDFLRSLLSVFLCFMVSQGMLGSLPYLPLLFVMGYVGYSVLSSMSDMRSGQIGTEALQEYLKKAPPFQTYPGPIHGRPDTLRFPMQ